MKYWIVPVAALALGVAVLATCGKAQAAAETCTVGATTLPFGNFDVYSAPMTVTATLAGTCKKGSGTLPSITITLDNGLNIQGSGNRAMSCSTCTGAFLGDLLQYQIYTTASLTTVWSGVTTVTAVNPCPCVGNTSVAWGPVTMYGQIFTAVAGGINDSAVGTYGDTVTATVNY